MSNQLNNHEGEHHTPHHTADVSPWLIIFRQYRTDRESSLLGQTESLSEKLVQLQDRLQQETPKLGMVAKNLGERIELYASFIRCNANSLGFWIQQIESSIQLFAEGCKKIEKSPAQAEKRMGAVLDLYGNHRDEIDQDMRNAVKTLDFLEEIVSESSRACQSFQQSQHGASDALHQQLKECTADLNEMRTNLQNLQRAISRTHPSTTRLSRQVAELPQEKSKQLEEQKKSYLDQLAKKSSETQDLQEKLDASKRNNDNLLQKLRDSEKKLSEQIEQYQKSQKEGRALSQHPVDEQRRNQELNSSHEAAKESLSSEHTREVQELREQLDQRDAENEALVKSHPATIEQLQSEHQKEVRTTHGTALQSLKAEYHKEIDHFNRRLESKDSFARGLVSTHAENIQRLHAKHKDKIDELNGAIAGLKESKAKQVEEAKLAKREHQSSLRFLQNQHNAVSSQLTQSEEETQSLHRQLVELQAKNAALQEGHQGLASDLRELRQTAIDRNLHHHEVVLRLSAIIEEAMTTAAERGASSSYREMAALSFESRIAKHEVNETNLRAENDTITMNLESVLHRDEEKSENISVLLSALVVVAMLLAVSWWY